MLYTYIGKIILPIKQYLKKRISICQKSILFIELNFTKTFITWTHFMHSLLVHIPKLGVPKEIKLYNDDEAKHLGKIISTTNEDTIPEIII